MGIDDGFGVPVPEPELDGTPLQENRVVRFIDLSGLVERLVALEARVEKRESESKVIQLRVSGRTNCTDLGWSICKHHQEGRRVELVAIGTQAVNQAVKAVAIASGQDAAHGRVYQVMPAMEDVTVRDEIGQEVTRTAIKLKVRVVVL